MRFSGIGILSCVSATILSSVAALDLLAPGHAVAELLVVPKNVTIMTPRARKPGFEQQLFDFGSAQTGFSELRRVFERQACSTGYGLCPNDAGICCPIGGRCCGAGRCCGSGRWCYASGCCQTSQNGCDDAGCCDKSQNCCRGGSCCDSGNECVLIDGKLGCCPTGQTCTSGPTCTTTGYVPCSGDNFCCPRGYTCYRDAGNNPMCRDPNQPSVTSTRPSATSVVPEPSSTPEPSPSPAPPTTREEPTQPPVQTSIEPDPTTAPQVTRTSLVSSAGGGATTRGVTTTTTTTPSTGAGASLNNSGGSSTNVGAIAGGTVAGVIAIALLVLIVVMWQRRQAANNTLAPAPTPAPAPAPTEPGPGQYPAYGQPNYNDPAYNQPAYNQPGYGQEAYNPGPTPPTPGTGDPFLTPMAQHQGLGASYFAPGPASPGPSGTGSGTGTQYTGLPEPQPADYAGGAVAGDVSMPSPRRDGAQPRPLPMSITSMQGGANSTRWSGYADSTPSSGLNATGYAGYPEVDSNNSQPRWSTPPAPNMAQPARAPSTVYQPSSHDGGYDEMYPPQSPPPVSLYGGMAPSVGGSGLPSGAAPPVTNFAPGEKQVYRPAY